MSYLAAAIQFDPVLGEIEANMSCMLALCEEAAMGGARVIVLPEMASCGYAFRDRAEVAPFAEPVPGPNTERLAACAQRLRCVIVCGLPEMDAPTGLFYNTAIVLGPQGYIGKYRKVHFFSADAKWGTEGDLGFPVWNTPFGRIGVQVCMDGTYPEGGRLLALQGADLICFPTNWVGSPCPEQRWISQAWENGVYWIAANRSGEERGLQFMGGSCIIDPDGAVQAVAGRPTEIVYAEIDLQRTTSRQFLPGRSDDKLADRHPELYPDMLRNAYGWSPAYYHRLYGAPALPPPRQSRVGVLQFTPTGDRAANCATIRDRISESACDLIVLPSLALSGPYETALSIATGSWETDLNALVELAADTGVLLCTTLPEPHVDGMFHTVVLIGPGGPLSARRSTHLDMVERLWATPGTVPPRTVDTPLGRLGLLTGYEACFWENMRVLATDGADLVCVPAALHAPRSRPIAGTGRTWTHWRVKAWESCLALALADYSGDGYAGGSGIWVPDVREDRWQEHTAEPGETGLVTADIDTASRYIREKRGLSWRRLPLYTGLVRSRSAPASSATKATALA